MKHVVLFFGGLLTVAGIGLLLAPHILFDFLENNKSSTWLYLMAIGVRLLLGLALILSANRSKYPLAIKILGYLTLAVAISFIIMGKGNFQDIMASIVPIFMPYGRIAGVVAILLGGFLLIAYQHPKN